MLDGITTGWLVLLTIGITNNSSQLCHDQLLSSHCGWVQQEGHWVCSLWPETKMENHFNCRRQVRSIHVWIYWCYVAINRRKQTEEFSHYKHSAYTDPCDNWDQVHRTNVQQYSGMWVIMYGWTLHFPLVNMLIHCGNQAITIKQRNLKRFLLEIFLNFLFLLFFCYAVPPTHLQFMHHSRTCTDKMASNS